jgi:hypothetical protein
MAAAVAVVNTQITVQQLLAETVAAVMAVLTILMMLLAQEKLAQQILAAVAAELVEDTELTPLLPVPVDQELWLFVTHLRHLFH